MSEKWLDEFCREVVLHFDSFSEDEQEFFRKTWRRAAERLYALAILGQ